MIATWFQRHNMIPFEKIHLEEWGRLKVHDFNFRLNARIYIVAYYICFILRFRK